MEEEVNIIWSFILMLSWYITLYWFYAVEEKNVCDNLIGTLSNIKDKAKDVVSACKDHG